jgi:AcrR family transcriptional regulator
MTEATTADGSERRLRRDAAENRVQLLDAAAKVFAAQGLDASVEEIARVAGVGIGTLYRRFPNKEALITELVQDLLDVMSQLAIEGLQKPDGTGLEFFLVESSAYQAKHRGCLARLWNTDPDNESIRNVRATISTLLDDAKAHGRVRAELTSTDLTVAMWSIRGVIETTREHAPEAWRRYLEIVVAGLRPSGEPLRHPPISRALVDKVVANQ